MSSVRSVDLERQDERSLRHRGDSAMLDSTAAASVTPPLEGPASRRPAAVLQRQALLGNAHVGRVFRSPAGPDAPEDKKDCDCPDEEHCSCPK